MGTVFRKHKKRSSESLFHINSNVTVMTFCVAIGEKFNAGLGRVCLKTRHLFWNKLTLGPQTTELLFGSGRGSQRSNIPDIMAVLLGINVVLYIDVWNKFLSLPMKI